MSDPHSSSSIDYPDLSVLLLRAASGDWLHDRRIRAALDLPSAPSEGPVLVRGQRGKPILPSTAPGKIRRFFNISHCEGWLAMAHSRTGQVGIDIERLTPYFDLSLTATPHTLSPAERGWLSDIPEADRAVRFLLLWTRKEALLKAVGSGISCRLDRVPALPPVVRGWRLRSFTTADVVMSVATRQHLFRNAGIHIDGVQAVHEVIP